jgi:uncharacterized protein with PIN domain
MAKEHACRLLYIGDDLSKTDVESLLEHLSALACR